jgi:hypothetical protein
VSSCAVLHQYMPRHVPISQKFLQNVLQSGDLAHVTAMLTKCEDFLIGIVAGGVNWVHSALRPLRGLLCQPRVIMMMEYLVEWLAGEPKYSEKTCPSAALSTTNPHMLSVREPGPPRWEASD